MLHDAFDMKRSIITALVITATAYFGFSYYKFVNTYQEGKLQTIYLDSLNDLSIKQMTEFRTDGIMTGTLGHIITGLKVVTVTGNSISFGQAFKRRLLDGVDILAFFGLVAYITVKNTERNQRVGDIWASTIVVGGESANCQNCGEHLTLSPDDTLRGTFKCPECGTKNEN